jgi:hypothetical protein
MQRNQLYFLGELNISPVWFISGLVITNTASQREAEIFALDLCKDLYIPVKQGSWEATVERVRT